MTNKILAITAVFFAAACASDPEPVYYNYANTDAYPAYYYQ